MSSSSSSSSPRISLAKALLDTLRVANVHHAKITNLSTAEFQDPAIHTQLTAHEIQLEHSITNEVSSSKEYAQVYRRIFRIRGQLYYLLTIPRYPSAQAVRETECQRLSESIAKLVNYIGTIRPRAPISILRVDALPFVYTRSVPPLPVWKSRASDKRTRWKWYRTATLADGRCSMSSILNAMQESTVYINDTKEMDSIRRNGVYMTLARWDEYTARDPTWISHLIRDSPAFLRQLKHHMVDMADSIATTSTHVDILQFINGTDKVEVQRVFVEVFDHPNEYANIETGLRSIAAVYEIGIIVFNIGFKKPRKKNEEGEWEEAEDEEVQVQLAWDEASSSPPQWWCVIVLQGAHFETLYLHDSQTNSNYFWVTNEEKKDILDSMKNTQSPSATLERAKILHATYAPKEKEKESPTSSSSSSSETAGTWESWTNTFDWSAFGPGSRMDVLALHNSDDQFEPDEESMPPVNLIDGTWHWVPLTGKKGEGDCGAYTLMHLLQERPDADAWLDPMEMRRQIAARLMLHWDQYSYGIDNTELAFHTYIKETLTENVWLRGDRDFLAVADMHHVGFLLAWIQEDGSHWIRTEIASHGTVPSYWAVILADGRHFEPVYYTDEEEQHNGDNEEVKHMWFTHAQIQTLTPTNTDFNAFVFSWQADRNNRIREKAKNDKWFAKNKERVDRAEARKGKKRDYDTRGAFGYWSEEEEEELTSDMKELLFV